MRTLITKTVIIVLLLFYFVTPTLAWQLTKNQSGIKVYLREKKGSAFKQYRAVGYVNASISSLVAIMNDTAYLKNWINRTKKAEILKQISATESVNRTVTAAPWPLKDRETIYHTKFSQTNSGVVTVTSKAWPNYLPKNSMVRVTKMRALWRFTPMKNGRVKIEHIGHVNPGGSIPAWAANLFVVDIPFKTMKGLITHVKKKRFKSAKIDFIQEP